MTTTKRVSVKPPKKQPEQTTKSDTPNKKTRSINKTKNINNYKAYFKDGHRFSRSMLENSKIQKDCHRVNGNDSKKCKESNKQKSRKRLMRSVRS